MIIKEVSINDNIFDIGIAQFKLESKDLNYEQFFKNFENFQNKYNEIVIQVFNNQYILNGEHIFNACYYLEKAFLNNSNISNKKHIELLLYLAANRQIKIALEDFGIFNQQLINLCLISLSNNFQSLNHEFESTFDIKLEHYWEYYSKKKYEDIKSYFNFSDNQIDSILASYSIKVNPKNIQEPDLPKLYLALNELICEKMSLIYLEKFSLD